MFSNVADFAEGGNSFVYQAEYKGQPVAIKVYNKLGDNKRYKRFLQELHTLQQLKDIDGIVPVLDLNTSPPETVTTCDKILSLSDIAYYVMPKYPRNLSERLGQKSIGDDGRSAVLMILSIAKTIKRLHDMGLAHRDLKPENILVDDNGDLVVADFGLSIDLNNTVERFTPATEIVGALNYRAPEFLRGRLDDSDHRPGDVFSLGRILWALIFDREAYNLTDLEFEKTLSAITFPIRKPRVLQDLIRGATSVDPKYRLNIEEFLADIENWLLDHNPGSVAGIINKMINDPETVSFANHIKIAQDVQEKHRITVDFIVAELTELTKGWNEIAEAYIKSVGVGNRLDISCSGGYISDFSPEALNFDRVPNVESIYVRFNVGKFPLIHFAVYIKTDFDKYGNQKYFVVPAYIPVDQKQPQLALDVVIKDFDYNSANIRQQILADLQIAYESLDRLLRE